MEQRSSFEIVLVRIADDLAATAGLFSAYAASLDVDLAYQDFAAELAGLPGLYAPPDGELLLARDLDGMPIGCAALRPMTLPGCCEMKRLYVSPPARGLGLGNSLIEALIGVAVRIGIAKCAWTRCPPWPERRRSTASWASKSLNLITQHQSRARCSCGASWADRKKLPTTLLNLKSKSP